MNGLLSYPEQENIKCATGVGAYVAPTSRQVLEEKLKHRLKEVDEVKAAIAFFDANPTFEQGLNLLQKALR